MPTVCPAKRMPLEPLEGAREPAPSNVEHRFLVLRDGSIVEARAGLTHDLLGFRVATQQMHRTSLIDVRIGIVRRELGEPTCRFEALLRTSGLRIRVREKQAGIDVM